MNRVQHWALAYHYYLVRRDKLEDRADFLEELTLNLNPDMWIKRYRDQVLGQMGMPNEEGEIPLTTDDIDGLDRFMEEQEKAWIKERQFQKTLTGTSTMSGAQAPGDWQQARAGQAAPLQWGPWQ